MSELHPRRFPDEFEEDEGWMNNDDRKCFPDSGVFGGNSLGLNKDGIGDCLHYLGIRAHGVLPEES